MVQGCYVQFVPKDQESLTRLKAFFDLVKAYKISEEDERNENTLTQFLSNQELDFFWNPSKEEEQEWNEFWESTPVDVRLSEEMLEHPWHLESMYEALWNGDYDLLDICSVNGNFRLNFEPHGFPYGGTGCLVAVVECFGHKVVGIDDGTGHLEYVAPPVWRSSKSKK